MRIRWSVVLPLIGLFLFVAVSYRSMRDNQTPDDGPTKYYWWSSLRLDTDPLNKDPVLANPRPCGKEEQNCWEFRTKWVTPGLIDRVLGFSAFPAFLAGAAIVAGLSKLGVDEVLTFFVSMPILLFGWYYLVGWLIDRWLDRRARLKNVPLKLG